MLAALLLLAAAGTSQSVVEAERSFAAMAQTHGQWTAFRAFAAPNAVMFVPEPVNAQEWLKDKKDPLVPVMWWPARAIVSCDGSTALTTGPWARDGGKSRGYFTTVWQRQPDGSWKWLLDHGILLDEPRPTADEVAIRSPDCRSRPIPPIVQVDADGKKDWDIVLSKDLTLMWSWRVAPNGSRSVTSSVWNGREYEQVLIDEVRASQ